MRVPWHGDGPTLATTGVSQKGRRMPTKTHVVKAVFPVLCLSMLALQNGCSNSGGGDTQTPTSNASAIHLSLSTTTGATAVVADGSSTIPIRIQVTNAAGAGMAGVPVTFATTAGALLESPVVRATRDVSIADETAILRAEGSGSVTVSTDTNGVAQVLLTATTTAETAVVTADALGFRTNIVIDFVPGPPAHVQLDASPPSLTGGGTATLTATVTDTNGNPIPGEAVTFTFSTNTSGAKLDATSGTTDSNGQVTLMYTAGFTLGADTVRAVAMSTGVAGATSIIVTVAPVTSLVTAIDVVAGSPNVVADGTSTVAIRATVSVASGAPTGIPVTFTTTAGRVSSTTTAADTDGVATVTLTSATSLGTATVTASAGGFNATTTVTFVAGAPAVVQLSANPTTVNAGGVSTLTATVTDATGNLVSGQTITFSPPMRGTLSALNGSTDTNGQLTVTYTAGTTPGTETLQAKATNEITGTVDITTTSAPVGGVASITVVAGAPTVVADGSSGVAIRATISVTSGALAGIPVVFTTTAGSLSSTTATTDATGAATVNLVAATSLGAVTVTASAGGFSANVTVTFVAGSPAVVQLSATPMTVSIGGGSTIQATVMDAKGNPPVGQALVFSLSADSKGSLTPLSGVTDTNGRVTVTYTAGATPSTDMVQVRTVNGITGTLQITVTPPSGANHLDLLASSPQLGSNGTGSVTLTALARDASNNVVSGVPVSFQADSGGIQVTSGTTGATGTATALLTTGGDQSNRTITVTATTGNLSSRNIVQVTGTSVSVSGASTLVLGATTRLSILLSDSGGNGIQNKEVTVISTLGNTLSATTGSTTTVMTDSTGQATVTVTATVPGTDTIQASALGATGTATLSISSANFAFTAPLPDAEVPLNTPQPVTVHWEEAGIPVPDGRTVNFFTTRGTLSAPSAMTVNGEARVTISSNEAGPAVINANVTGGPSSQVRVEFFATTPSSLVLQAFPTTLGVNSTGSTAQQSIITAVVQDVNGNLVKNQTVSFALTDVTGGSIFPASGVTDSFGRASTVYTSGTVPSAQNGVIITATVGTVLPVQVRLTVAQQALFVTLGTGNVVLTPSNIQFALPYSVLITDANGNAVTNATVELTVLPTRYQKGMYVQIGSPCTGWGQIVSSTCDNEDVNHNGVLDMLPVDEDTNNNNELDPENPASVPGRIITDANGFAFFNVVYAREFASWIEVDLRARATVTGSEGLSHTVFFLPGLASDYTNCNVAPPGVVSPYGTAATCTDPN
jgi:adhesin/invasin